ncbi:MAG TPA: DUF2254 domain-containing protein [Alphaproteobacteria bacterium]|nr:DUF2254 domain-containing protein [Alphaproteobacteria bacterium]
MSSQLLAIWEHARGSYWFLPSLMVVAAFGLSLASIAIDDLVGAQWLDESRWLYTNKAEGARTLLGTIAGSMIGVAGVSFSITIATFAQAAIQFGPRLISNFMRDRGNQAVLGTLLATFVFALMILRTIQASTESSPAFVPHVSILLALALSLVSLGMLIFFIHHIPESIDVSNMVARIGRGLDERLRALPEIDAEKIDILAREDSASEGFQICGDSCGYVLRIDESRLLRIACEADMVIRLDAVPGDFVRADETLASVTQAERVDEELRKRLAGAFVIGQQRSPTQDILFLFDELVEVATRALSPSANDIFTAIACMHWLGNALARGIDREFGFASQMDGSGSARLIGRCIPFEVVLDRVCDTLRPSAEKDPTAALQFLEMLAGLKDRQISVQQRNRLLDHVEALRSGSMLALRSPRDRQVVERRANTLIETLENRHE